MLKFFLMIKLGMEILFVKIWIVYYNFWKMVEIFVICDLGVCKMN